MHFLLTDTQLRTDLRPRIFNWNWKVKRNISGRIHSLQLYADWGQTMSKFKLRMIAKSTGILHEMTLRKKNKLVIFERKRWNARWTMITMSIAIGSTWVLLSERWNQAKNWWLHCNIKTTIVKYNGSLLLIFLKATVEGVSSNSLTASSSELGYIGYYSVLQIAIL